MRFFVLYCLFWGRWLKVEGSTLCGTAGLKVLGCWSAGPAGGALRRSLWHCGACGGVAVLCCQAGLTVQLLGWWSALSSDCGVCCDVPAVPVCAVCCVQCTGDASESGLIKWVELLEDIKTYRCDLGPGSIRDLGPWAVPSLMGRRRCHWQRTWAPGPRSG